MTVVSDSSPLITLARIRCFDLLRRLYGTIYISAEVHAEVVIHGAGMPGAIQTAHAAWIEVRNVKDTKALADDIAEAGLGAGEMSAIALARELSADLILIDEWKARRLAREKGFPVIGCVGILEDLHEQGELTDLRAAYQRLIQNKTRIDLQTLQHSLRRFQLPPL